MKPQICSLVLALLLAGAAIAEPDQVEALQKGMPAEVSDLISRIVGCNHWSGEPPYDEERQAEISKALSDLRCDEIGTDEQSILRTFGTAPGVKEAVAAAKQVFL